MEKVLIDGEMEECLLDSIKMIGRVELAFIYGLMEEPTMENGRAENKTALAFILCLTLRTLTI